MEFSKPVYVLYGLAEKLIVLLIAYEIAAGSTFVHSVDTPCHILAHWISFCIFLPSHDSCLP